MKYLFKSTALVACLTVGTHGAWADAADGLALAEEYCVRCHDIAPGGAAKTYPPSFASIAWFRSEDLVRVRILFPEMHAAMPAWANWLSPDEVDSLVAYIVSLEGS